LILVGSTVVEQGARCRQRRSAAPTQAGHTEMAGTVAFTPFYAKSMGSALLTKETCAMKR
jgi:hypothetical protein